MNHIPGKTFSKNEQKNNDNDDDYNDDDDDELFLCMVDQRGPYFHWGILPEILIIKNFRHAISRVLTCVKFEFRLS